MEEKNICWKRVPKILLAEDNEINREIATTILEEIGCKVLAVEDGAAAVEMVEEHDFDLVFMDCKMPNVDGYEAVRQIRKLSSTKSEVTIVALTAHSTVHDRDDCFAVGMNDYVGKPYKRYELKQILCKWLAELVEEYIEEKIPQLVEPVHMATSHSARVIDRKAIHDLRNALTAILGSAELAQRFEDRPEMQSRQLENILKAAEKAVAITSEM